MTSTLFLGAILAVVLCLTVTRRAFMAASTTATRKQGVTPSLLKNQLEVDRAPIYKWTRHSAQKGNIAYLTDED